ncbi:MAG: hypothetical protein H0T71_04475 [Acidobacteria bacterium]|nr:hypothetical protein [Acidobacteriota bacterium]
MRSAVVRLTFRRPPAEVPNPALLVEIVRSVFTQRRKTLSNALAPFASSRGHSAAQILVDAGIDPQRRPETLTLLDYAALSGVFLRG